MNTPTHRRRRRCPAPPRPPSPRRPRAWALALAAACALGLAACEEDTIEPTLFGDVFGEVLETEDNVAIGQVTVSTNPPTSSVITDATGRFVLEGIPEGTYSLRAEASGYLTEVTSVAVFGDQVANVIVRLEPDTLENAPPEPPTLLSPADGARRQRTDLTLRWSGHDPDGDDELAYEVLLFDAADTTRPTSVARGLTDTTYALTGLDFGANYFWQVRADDGVNPPVSSPVSAFSTEAFPDLRILFARSTGGVYDVYAADEFGREIRLTDGVASSWRPRMNPQRDAIAFIANPGVRPQLFLMDRDGDNVRQVTTLPISGAGLLELDFCWSPDGARLLYMAGNRLYVVNKDGSGLAPFAQALSGYTFAECDWTAQGGGTVAARMVGASAYESVIATYDAGGDFAQLVVSDGPGATGGPTWSVPGTSLLYTYDASGYEDIDGRQLDAGIYRRDVSTTATQFLSFEKTPGTNDLDAVYSPDGSRIVFTNTNNDGISRRDVYVMDADGTDRRLLFEDAEMPEWR